MKVTPEEEALLLQLALAQGVTVPRLLVEAATSRTGETSTQRRAAIAELLAVCRLLAAVSRQLADKVFADVQVNTEQARAYAEGSPSIVTPLNRYIGYEEAAARYERGLETIELAAEPDAEVGCELLLGLGEARWSTGEMEAARGAFLRAADVAERLATVVRERLAL